jgi:NADH:ubiquinone oxidoreductase subunit H
LLVCVRLGVNALIIVVWSSDSGCCLLQGLHALAQTVPSEVRLAFISFSGVVLLCRYNLGGFYNTKFYS